MPDAVVARLWVLAGACALASVALGLFVAPRPPMRLDVAAGALRGTGVGAALFFTTLGRWPVIAGLGVLAFGTAMALRSGASAVAVLLAAQTASQGANALAKLAFHRARPDAWLVVRETDLSYPSGHAASAIVLFAGLAVLAWHAPLPRAATAPLAGALAACACGIAWSRIALGAHYLTDVLGGLLLGAAFLCAALAIILRLSASATTA